MPTLLQTMTEERAARNERLRVAAREELRGVLRELLPQASVIVYGSLTHPGRFTNDSDIDLALFAEPPGISVYQLIAVLCERMGRRVDVVLLPETRLRDEILRRGETWMP